VIDPPSSSTVKVPVHKSATLSCTSRGSPPDTFIWMKDGSPVTSSPILKAVNHDSTAAVFRSDYTIKSVTRSDTGTYICTVTNPIGSDSRIIYVIGVHGKLLYYCVLISISLSSIFSYVVEHMALSNATLLPPNAIELQ